VRGAQFSESPESGVVKVSVSEIDAHDGPQCAVEGLDEPIGDSRNKIVDDLLPPIVEGDDELGRLFVAGPVGFENFTTGHILTSLRRREGDRYGEIFIQ